MGLLAHVAAAQSEPDEAVAPERTVERQAQAREQSQTASPDKSWPEHLAGFEKIDSFDWLVEHYQFDEGKKVLQRTRMHVLGAKPERGIVVEADGELKLVEFLQMSSRSVYGLHERIWPDMSATELRQLGRLLVNWPDGAAYQRRLDLEASRVAERANASADAQSPTPPPQCWQDAAWAEARARSLLQDLAEQSGAVLRPAKASKGKIGEELLTAFKLVNKQELAATVGAQILLTQRLLATNKPQDAQHALWRLHYLISSLAAKPPREPVLAARIADAVYLPAADRAGIKYTHERTRWQIAEDARLVFGQAWHDTHERDWADRWIAAGDLAVRYAHGANGADANRVHLAAALEQLAQHAEQAGDVQRATSLLKRAYIAPDAIDPEGSVAGGREHLTKLEERLTAIWPEFPAWQARRAELRAQTPQPVHQTRTLSPDPARTQSPAPASLPNASPNQTVTEP